MRSFKNRVGAVGILLMFSVSAVFAMKNHNTMDHGIPGHDSVWCAQNIHQYGFVGGGVSWVNLGNINNDLTNARLSSFREFTGTGSIGMQKQVGRLIMESALTSLFWKDHVDSTIRTSVWMGNILWNTGFNILPSEVSATLFPLVGIGVGLNTINVRNNEKTFTQLLASTEPSSSLWQTAFLVNVGMGTDLNIANDENTKGVVVGLRGGYLLDLFNKSTWNSGGVMVNDLSSMSQGGAYVRLVLGGWNKHSMRK